MFCCRAKIGDEIKKLRNMVVNSFAEASKIRERIQTAAESQIVANPFAHSTERTPVETVETVVSMQLSTRHCTRKSLQSCAVWKVYRVSRFLCFLTL